MCVRLLRKIIPKLCTEAQKAQDRASSPFLWGSAVSKRKLFLAIFIPSKETVRNVRYHIYSHLLEDVLNNNKPFRGNAWEQGRGSIQRKAEGITRVSAIATKRKSPKEVADVTRAGKVTWAEAEGLGAASMQDIRRGYWCHLQSREQKWRLHSSAGECGKDSW